MQCRDSSAVLRSRMVRAEVHLLLGKGDGVVFGLSETWLDESVMDSEVEIPGFKQFRRDRNRRGGGVMVYVPEQFRVIRRKELEDNAVEALWIEVRTVNRVVLVCNVYRPPDAPAVWFDDFASMMERAAGERAERIVLGDFNCNMLKRDGIALKLEGATLEYGLVQVMNCPTRVTETSESMIDLMFTSEPEVLRSVGCEEVGLSDHGLIYGILDTSVQKQQQCLRLIRCLRKCDVEALLSDLDTAPWSVMDSFEDIDSRWEYWKSLFEQIVASHIPMRKVRVREKTLPWIGNDVRRLMRARNYHRTKARNSKRAEDWMQYRKLRNLVTWELKKAKLKYFESVSRQSTKKLWKELNRVLGRRSRHNIEAIRTPNGRVTSQQGIVEELSRHFSMWSGVLGVDDNVDTDQWDLPFLDSEFKFEKVDEEDVLKLLRGLDVNKAVGLDNISAKLLRMTAPVISRSLASLLNFSLENGQVANDWKLARVTPVPKESSSENLDNFRPVSVLPVIAKVLERVVHRQLYVYLEKYSILNVAQSGFRPQHTTQDVLVSTIDDWRQALDEDKLVGSIMVDLSKAFDMVSHTILLKKLASYGVRAGELRWFDNYLNGRRQRVCINGVQSCWTDILRGVPQGSILGPLLFTIYVNDLPQSVVHGKIKQYADDTTLYTVSDNITDLSNNLSMDLAGVTEWVERNGLQLNQAKTQMILLSRKKRSKELENVVVKLKGQEVARSRKVKYLGVWVDEGLTWVDHVEAVRRKCLGGLAKLRRLRDTLPAALKKNIYNALVLPHLDYCCVLWQECGIQLQKRVERIQNYAMRLICSKPPRTPSEELRSDMNWMPLSKRRELFRLVLVHRCVHGRAPAYLAECYETNKQYGHCVTRGANKLHLKSVNTEFGRRATMFKGAQEWNKLPADLRNVQNINTFRKLLKTQYICGIST